MSSPSPLDNSARLLAAVDLGSNSFRLVVTQVSSGSFRTVDQVRERVQFGAGLDAEGDLDADTKERALACLERFGERLRSIPAENVRAVGTYGFRRLRNSREFLRHAEKRLGQPIEIVSGREEARLIYDGVVSTMHPWNGRRLVIDIGGGSTEFILGEGRDLVEAESLPMGCISFTQKFFRDGRTSRARFQHAVTTARLFLSEYQDRFRSPDWNVCLGTSGTIRSIRNVLCSIHGDGPITYEQLLDLQERVTEARQTSKLSLPNLREDRRAILPGGLSVLLAAFESLGIDSMEFSVGGMKEGLLGSLIGRLGDEDLRDITVRRLVQQYAIDEAQGYRVEATALALLGSTASSWGLAGRYDRQLLSWASRLHEIGLTVAHSAYHKHGDYLLHNGDMPGFSKDDQKCLAALVRNHRKKLAAKRLRGLPHLDDDRALRLCLLLRLAVLFNRDRSGRSHALDISAHDNTLTIAADEAWIAQHPLTVAELEQEAHALKAVGYELALETVASEALA